MVALTPGVPFDIGQPVLDIDGGLEPGAWTVQLVVIDDDENESAPQLLELKIGERPVVPQPQPEPGPVRPGRPRFPGGVFDTGGVFTPRRPIPLDPDIVLTPRPRRPIDPRVVIRRPPR